MIDVVTIIGPMDQWCRLVELERVRVDEVVMRVPEGGPTEVLQGLESLAPVAPAA